MNKERMDRKIAVGLRLGSMLLDHCVMCFLIAPPLIILDMVLGSKKPFETPQIIILLFYLMMLVYLNKDFVKGRSIAKRILGLKVVDAKSGEPANELKCFLRNMTIPIWPLEIFVTLFSRSRRLGDFFANTRVESANKENATSIFKELKTTRLSSTSYLTFIIGIVYMALIGYLFQNLTI